MHMITVPEKKGSAASTLSSAMHRLQYFCSEAYVYIYILCSVCTRKLPAHVHVIIRAIVCCCKKCITHESVKRGTWSRGSLAPMPLPRPGDFGRRFFSLLLCFVPFFLHHHHHHDHHLLCSSFFHTVTRLSLAVIWQQQQHQLSRPKVSSTYIIPRIYHYIYIYGI